MKRLVLLLLAIISGLGIYGFVSYEDGVLTRPRLREVLGELGYEIEDIVKDPGKEKYSVKFSNSDLNIPIGYEISPSNTYIWLTVNLGEAPKEANEKCLTLLKQNSKVQPTFFYITESGRLMAALPVENRGVTNLILKQRSDSLAANVGKTKEFWQ
jgi:hypothetical protein